MAVRRRIRWWFGTCLTVLRSPDFGQLRDDRLLGPMRLAMKLGGRGPAPVPRGR